MLLDRIESPSSIKQLSLTELEQLAQEIRCFIISAVGKNGGHLASNLGTVELTLALHREFDIPQDILIFDVGHQAYTHKILTGRKTAFEKLRKCGGCAGFPSPEESSFDTAVSGHAGVAVSLARGIASGRQKTENPSHVIAVIGDGSLTSGVTFEGLNSGSDSDKKLIVILNDNKMSISKNVGNISRYLNRIISGSFYNRLRNHLREISRPRKRFHSLLRKIDDAIKSAILPPGQFFQELGFRYFGPVDGHDTDALLKLFRQVKQLDGPILIHVLTTKGKGCSFAESEPSRYHGVPGFDPETGQLPPSGDSFSKAFGHSLLRQAENDDRIEAVSAAMLDGTCLHEFAGKYPSRCYDTGIAECHAVLFSCGLAISGRKPVCALYSTFAQRAFDCIYHDAVLAKLPVVFALDRAGIVEDGPTHHGIYDLGFLTALPGLTILAPRSHAMLDAMLDYAFKLNTPVVLRYPRGKEGVKTAALPRAPLADGRAEIVREGNGPVIWAMGAEIETALNVADILAVQAGMDCCVIDPRFIKPLDENMVQRYSDRHIVVIEDHVISAGLGKILFSLLAGNSNLLRLNYGWPDEIISYGKISEIREKYGMTPELIADDILKKIRKF
jgi:1-deoxy-D-xylulose-5-phosphate synthase